MNLTILQRIGGLLLPAIALALLTTLAACGGSDAPQAPATSATKAAPTDQTPLGPPPGSVATDREALIAIYNALDGPNWENSENWLSDAPLSEWYGVTTAENGRVIWLQIGLSGSGQALRREIPPEVGDLGALTVLTLSGLEASLLDGSSKGVQLGGEIPPELGNLGYLTDLSLTWSELSGPIPPELGNLSNLYDLTLSSNQLTGEIPPELSNSTGLTHFDLSGNQLSGEIPLELAELANRSTLYELNLSGNRLTGEIPSGLANVTGVANFTVTMTILNLRWEPVDRGDTVRVGEFQHAHARPQREPVGRDNTARSRH